MTVLALEIQDAGIVAVRDGAVVGHPSPGYALVEGESVVTGDAALEWDRIKPRRIENRFWSDLGAAPLERPFPSTLSRADLAHAHLESVWSRVGEGVERVILVLPGSFTREQLGLLLGITRACSMPVTGMVDAAVAGTVRVAGGQILHLDLELHRTVLISVAGGDDRSRVDVRMSDSTGLAGLRDTWAKKIAQAFVAGTRFDPLHDARTEQALYLQLPRIRERVQAAGNTAVTLEWSGREHSIEVKKEDLTSAAGKDHAVIVELLRHAKVAGETATVVLTERAAALPGLREEIETIGDTLVVSLESGAAGRGALRSLASIETEGEALPFVTRLPAGETMAPEVARPVSVAPNRAAGGRPTHVLHEGRAYPIGGDPLVLGIAPAGEWRSIRLAGETAGISRSHCRVSRVGEQVFLEDTSTHGTFLNGQRIDGKVELRAGDRVRLGTPGIELGLIVVVDDDGPPQH